MLARVRKFLRKYRQIVLTVSNVSLLIFLLRSLGVFQPLAWWALDLSFKSRPQEWADNRIVVVALEESDIQKYKQWPVSDRLLARLINKIKSQNPRVIGLDLHRDIPVPPGYDELAEVFQTTPNLIGIKKAGGDGFYPPIAAPPILDKSGQVGASDLVIDTDGVLRRAILFPRTEDDPALPSLGLAVAMKYLDKGGIEPKASPDGGWLQLGNRVFYPIEKNEGSYIDVGTAEYQIMLNYRSERQPFKTVTFEQVLENRISPGLFKDRIVLIGSRAISLKDYFYTPYSKGENSSPLLTYGVEIHAHVASQLISTVLDGRPLIKSPPEPLEYLWIFSWILLPSLWAWRWRNIGDARVLFLIVGSGTLLGAVFLIAIVYLAFLNAWWIPVVSPLFGLVLSSLAISCTIYINRLGEANSRLEEKVKERTLELRENNRRLEAALQQVERTQTQLIAQEKQAYLGAISAGIAHEIRNPVNIIRNFADLSLESEKELRQVIGESIEAFGVQEAVNVEEVLDLMRENVEFIREQTLRLDLLVQALLPQRNFDPLKRSAVNINQLIDTIYKLVVNSKKVSSNEFKVELLTEYDNSLQEIEIVTPEVTQAILNIIDNAYDALYEKQLVSDEFRPVMKIMTKELVQDVEITVSDNGLGIPTELQAQIFKPFVSTKPPGQGTGLGLSIAYDIIVARHGGELRFETQPGEHTKFIIVLPILNVD
ncbi:MAG: Adaptive-response sensory-kinase SasA [Chroococcopsis gigantea SAG 12.99]|jgi:adenylate cyclase|nr:CHASE2 domain-containing protein [Chlorogloea purpurea SAG 13.99]MDV3001078.1 Adaptive-response sensory-kinase SasA [Chroococcopsis gigantea SAG 12.99]